MSIRRGNKIIAGSSGNGLQMFDFKWSDHTINDLNWIQSSANSWHSGNTYKKMYNHLLTDFTNGSSRSDTIGSSTIPYILAPDGHKIVDEEYESIVQDVFLATGVAWYYIIDTENHQFKLPRTNYAFKSGTTSDIGEYVEPGLPNITGTFADGLLTTTSSSSSTNPDDIDASGAFDGSHVVDRTAYPGNSSGWFVNGGINFDASRSSSIYGNSTTVQPPATKMLLYFYTAEIAVNSSSGGGGGSVSITYDETNKRLIFENEG